MKATHVILILFLVVITGAVIILIMNQISTQEELSELRLKQIQTEKELDESKTELSETQQELEESKTELSGTQEELNELKTTHSEEVISNLEETCERKSNYGVGEWESWINDVLVGDESLDTCKEICNSYGLKCTSGSIEQFYDDDRDSGAVIIACNTLFGVEKPGKEELLFLAFAVPNFRGEFL